MSVFTGQPGHLDFVFGPPVLDFDLQAVVVGAGGLRSFGWVVFEADDACTVGDGVAGFVAPSWMATYLVVAVQASVATPGTTGSMSVQLRRVRAGTPVDVLSTPVTVDSGAYTANDGVVNVANDDIQAGDMFYCDRDTVHTSAALGLSVIVTIQPA